jgi:hypothetical protein
VSEFQEGALTVVTQLVIRWTSHRGERKGPGSPAAGRASSNVARRAVTELCVREIVKAPRAWGTNRPHRCPAPLQKMRSDRACARSRAHRGTDRRPAERRITSESRR